MKNMKNSIKFMPDSLIFAGREDQNLIQRSVLRSVRSRIIDMIPLNQTILVEFSSERKN